MNTKNNTRVNFVQNFVPSDKERPQCTTDLVRKTRLHEIEYKRVLQTILRHIRSNNLKMKLREDQVVKRGIYTIYKHLRFIGKNGCHVQSDTKRLLTTLVRRVQLIDRSTKKQAKASTYSRYTPRTMDILIDIFSSSSYKRKNLDHPTYSARTSS